MSKAVFGYWSVKGIGEPIRMMLNYVGVDFEDKHYVCGDGPDYDESDWTDVKEKLGLEFPNLPYYIDGEVTLSESWAIMKYIARKHDLLPGQDHHFCDMLEGVITDFRKQLAVLTYSPDFKKLSVEFLEKTFPTKARRLESFLNGRQWIGGDKLTYVDFACCEFLRHVTMLSPECLKEYPKTSDYLERFFKLDKVAAYCNSDRYKTIPPNNKHGKWGISV